MVLPFGLLLACMAVAPLHWPEWWEKHYAKAALGLAGVTIGYYAFVLPPAAWQTVRRTGEDYAGFIALIGALYVISGGIHLRAGGVTTPARNTLFLALGGVASNLLGTTGASLLLIGPWLRLNAGRAAAHHVVFFIFIVSNAGGCLTPMGDPPLLVGFLEGVPFWWVARHCWPAWLAGMAYLLAVFYFVDRRHGRRAPPPSDMVEGDWAVEGGRKSGFGTIVGSAGASPYQTQGRARLLPSLHKNRFARVEGLWNIVFLTIIIAAVMIPMPPLPRIGIMLAAAVASYFATARRVHEANEFSFRPMVEVAVLFFGIFATLMPALDLLQASARGAAGHPFSATEVYWGSGGLSAFLDSAPAYLAFFRAMPAHAPEKLLAALSVATVLFGAGTYIGNGPNLMVKTIADHQEIPSPSFLAYLLKWAVPVMLPLLILVWFVFYR
jgi:Na+/H+ antiporter NhaD/arsenite permease-like protein